MIDYFIVGKSDVGHAIIAYKNDTLIQGESWRQLKQENEKTTTEREILKGVITVFLRFGQKMPLPTINVYINNKTVFHVLNQLNAGKEDLLQYKGYDREILLNNYDLFKVYTQFYSKGYRINIQYLRSTPRDRQNMKFLKGVR